MSKRLKQENIKVISTNKPTKEESAKKTQELCMFLGRVWRKKSLVPSIPNAQAKNQ